MGKVNHIVQKRTSSWDGSPDVASWFLSTLAVGTRTSYLISLFLSFHVCKIGWIVLPRGLNEMKQSNHLEQCPTHHYFILMVIFLISSSFSFITVRRPPSGSRWENRLSSGGESMGMWRVLCFRQVQSPWLQGASGKETQYKQCPPREGSPPKDTPSKEVGHLSSTPRGGTWMCSFF